MSLAKEAADSLDKIRYDLSSKNLVRYLDLAGKKWDGYRIKRVPSSFAADAHRVAQELADAHALKSYKK